MSQTGKSLITSTTILGMSASQIVGIIGQVATVAAATFAPGATVLGMSVKQLVDLAVGVANEVPEALDAVQMIKAHADAGTYPTDSEWAQINAACDAANAAAAAAEDRVINGTA